MIGLFAMSVLRWTGRWWEGNKGKLNVLIRRIIQTNSWSAIGGCSMEHCYLLGQMYSCLILKTLIQRLQSNQHFKENDQSRIFIEVCWSEFHDASCPLLDSGAAIDCELNKINHHFNTSWIKKRRDDGRTFFIQNSVATQMRGWRLDLSRVPFTLLIVSRSISFSSTQPCSGSEMMVRKNWHPF